MTRRRFALNKNILSAATFAGLALAFAACSSSPGTSGAGGSGTGGAATGGHGGTGAGGKIGTGGNGTGGANPGVGGMGVGGSQACLASPYNHVSTFGAILDGWVVATNSSPPTLAPMAGVDGGPATGTKVEIDTADGSPNTSPLGSVKLTIPFDMPNEELLFAQNMNGLNMSGATISAYIKLNSGLNTTPTDVGRAFLILKSGPGYAYVAGPATSLDSSAGWVQLSISADAPSATLPFGYDPCDIREIDVSVQTGMQGAYTTAVMHIDTISIARPGVDAGTDDAGTPDSRPDAPTDTPAVDAPAVDAPAVDVPAADVRDALPVDTAIDTTPAG